MKKNILTLIFPLVLMSCLVTFLTACLKTRSEVSEQNQNAVYGRKNADNQMEAQAAVATPVLEEKDELIRNLNGRVEVLENQLLTLQEDKDAANSQDSQKIIFLQEALAKMEAQLLKLENEYANNKASEQALKSSDDLASNKSDSDSKADTKADTKKLGTYDTAELHYNKGEWKKAIINYQKYTDESPRGKNVADAKYKIGLCFQELGMKEEAMAFYEEVVANYSTTAAGKKSKSRLGKLKK